MLYNRTFNKLYAKTHGYFWLPCPLCKQDFGGHEWTRSTPGKVSSIPNPSAGPGMGLGICPECTEKGLGYHTPIDWSAIGIDWSTVDD